MNIDTVVDTITATSLRRGVKVIIDHAKAPKKSDPVGSEAWFQSDPEPTIYVSAKGRKPKEWVSNLLHEYSHACQWRQNDPVWEACYIDDTDVSDLAELWVNHHIELSKSQCDRVFDALFDLEKDAERRTVNFIGFYGLSDIIDIKKYTREAWAYILSYKFTPYIRKWLPTSNPPWKVKSIVSSMPTSFDVDPPKKWSLEWRRTYCGW